MNQQTLTNTHNPADRLLRNALRGNAIFSEVSGLAALLLARPLTHFTGLQPAATFTSLGIMLIIYGIGIAWLSTRPKPNRAIVWGIILGDVAWVLGSILILLTGNPAFTVAGNWLVAILAEAVAAFAVAQYIGLRRITS